MARIRPISLCLFEKGHKILVQQFWHESKNHHYYRPPGGGIEFGETAIDAARREMKEELHATLESLDLFKVVENIFELDGRLKHELAFIFRASFADSSLYQKDYFLIEEENLPATKAVWMELDGFVTGRDILYPELLLKALV